MKVNGNHAINNAGGPTQKEKEEMRLGMIQILERPLPSEPVMSLAIEFDEDERQDIPRHMAEMSRAFIGGVDKFFTPDQTYIDKNSPVEEQRKYLSGKPASRYLRSAPVQAPVVPLRPMP